MYTEYKKSIFNFSHGCSMRHMVSLMQEYAMSAELRNPREVLGRSQEPMYGTRPWCLVQAITRHTCPDPHLGS